MSSEAARYFPRIIGESNEENSARSGEEPNPLSEAENAQNPTDSPSVSSEAGRTACTAEPSDEILLSRVSLGDREALALLFRRFARVVRSVAFRILRDEAEADDLLQDLFLFIHRKCGIFDSTKGTARSWIVQMTYQRAIDRRRYLISRHFYTRVNLDDSAMEISDPQGEILAFDQSLEAALGRTRLEEIDELLTDDQRKTIRLFFFEGYTLEEIAESLGQPIGNVRHHYYRGLERMRKHILKKKLRSDWAI